MGQFEGRGLTGTYFRRERHRIPATAPVPRMKGSFNNESKHFSAVAQTGLYQKERFEPRGQALLRRNRRNKPFSAYFPTFFGSGLESVDAPIFPLFTF